VKSLTNKRPDVWSVSPSPQCCSHPIDGGQNVGALPVLDGNHLVGLISERDYTRKVILKGRSSRKPRSRYHDEELCTATLDETIVDCMRLMTEKRVRHLPVLAGRTWWVLYRLATL